MLTSRIAGDCAARWKPKRKCTYCRNLHHDCDEVQARKEFNAWVAAVQARTDFENQSDEDEDDAAVAAESARLDAAVEQAKSEFLTIQAAYEHDDGFVSDVTTPRKGRGVAGAATLARETLGQVLRIRDAQELMAEVCSLSPLALRLLISCSQSSARQADALERAADAQVRAANAQVRTANAQESRAQVSTFGPLVSRLLTPCVQSSRRQARALEAIARGIGSDESSTSDSSPSSDDSS